MKFGLSKDKLEGTGSRQISGTIDLLETEIENRLSSSKRVTKGVNVEKL